MNITFTTANSSLQLDKSGSVAVVVYAVVGLATIGIGAAILAEKAVVAYKRRIIRKINQK